jgi:hypothetical protein
MFIIYYAHLPIYNKFRWLAAAHFERFLGGVQVEKMLYGVGHVVPRGYLFRGRFLGTSGDLGGLVGPRRRALWGLAHLLSFGWGN